MPLQQPLSKKETFVYILFMICAVFSVCFMFAQLSVLTFLKISMFITPLIILNVFAVGMYICMPPRKKLFGIISALVWVLICIVLCWSQFIYEYQGVFGPFVWVAKDLPYEVLIMIGVSINMYLLFTPFRIVYLTVPTPLLSQNMRDFGAGLLLPALAGFSCSVFHAVNNLDFLTLTTGSLFIGAFVLSGIVLYSLLAVSLRKVIAYKMISLTTAICMICWLFLPTFVAGMRMFYHPLWVHVAFLTILPLTLCYVFQQREKLVLLYLLLSLPISGYSYFTSQPFDMTKARQATEEKFPLPTLPASATISADAPNVYLIVYDGTPTLQMLEHLGIEGRNDLKDLLHDNNFRVYDNTYSVGQISLVSMSATYNMSTALPTTPLMWQANGGLAAGFEVFRKNGYRIESVQQAFMTSTYQHFDVNLPPREMRTLDKSDFLYFLFKAVLKGEFQFEDIIDAGGDLTPYKKTVFDNTRGRRVAVMHNYYPSHSQLSGQCLPNQKQLYETNFALARDMLRDDLDRIARNDPTAIVVVMGDHGPYLTSDCTSLAKRDPNTVTEEEIFDRFSTLVAIRWPDAAKGAKYGKDIRINQDILPAIFAYLYDSPEPLQWRIEPKAYLNGRLVIDNGAYCPVPKDKE